MVLKKDVRDFLKFSPSVQIKNKSKNYQKVREILNIKNKMRKVFFTYDLY